ncbi:MAG: hypothetical protein AUI14_15195 [Actinobacteria bacterium 13_2_20CM_2_71_6]|nr:MAG: hypothetical protein AUI14_15195 [Actinobacteria bacterium 13_2_20CM_2_71_6]
MDKPARAWVWDGGRACLDFVNTYRDRKTGGWELLRTPADFTAWLRAAGLTTTHAEVSTTRLRDARQLREAVNRCVDAVRAGQVCRKLDLDLVNRWSGRHQPLRAALRQGRAGVPERVVHPPRDPAGAALAEVAADAVDLLGTDDRALLRVCASDTCGLRFLDRSAAGSRQWCAMTRCGNRAKARAHRARSRPGG